MQLWTRLAGLATLVALTGCAANGAPMTATPDRPPFQSSPAATPAASTPADVPPARWQAILDDLSGRGVTATPTLTSAKKVTWNSGALGCPKPGAMYTQALVDGLHVLVSAGGVTYDYRFGTGDQPVLCEK